MVCIFASTHAQNLGRGMQVNNDAQTTMPEVSMPCLVRRESGPTFVADTPCPLYNLPPIDGPVSRALDNQSASTNQYTVLSSHGQALKGAIMNQQFVGQHGEKRTRETEPFRITPLPAAHQTHTRTHPQNHHRHRKRLQTRCTPKPTNSHDNRTEATTTTNRQGNNNNNNNNRQEQNNKTK